jgi:hypothetical protein
VNKRVSFHERAEFELNDAIVFLESERAGLGLRFLQQLKPLWLRSENIPKPHQLLLKTLDVRS